MKSKGRKRNLIYLEQQQLLRTEINKEGREIKEIK
jgi:hypothetical protein